MRLPCLGKEPSHYDSCTDCLHGSYECTGGLASSVDVVDDHYLTSTEEFVIDVYIVLDVRGQLVLSSDVGTLPATEYLYAVESVLCASEPAQHLGESFPPAYVSTPGTGRYAYDGHVRHIHSPEGSGQLMCCPAAVDITAILEAQDHPADILLFERGTLLVPTRDVIV